MSSSSESFHSMLSISIIFVPSRNVIRLSVKTLFNHCFFINWSFYITGVPIVHVIPSPFPHVWHKENDNRDSVHHATVDNLNKILRAFIAQYLHLTINLPNNIGMMK